MGGSIRFGQRWSLFSQTPDRFNLVFGEPKWTLVVLAGPLHINAMVVFIAGLPANANFEKYILIKVSFSYRDR